MRSQFLSEVESAKLATLEELNASFQAWVELIYHKAIHSETGEAPLERFQRSLTQITVRQADPTRLREAFLCMLVGISGCGKLLTDNRGWSRLAGQAAPAGRESGAPDSRSRPDPLGALPRRRA